MTLTFPRRRLAQLHEVHTGSGRHIVKEVPFPKWVPADVSAEASQLSEEDAAIEPDAWCSQLSVHVAKRKR
jgi:hypothetical protein